MGWMVVGREGGCGRRVDDARDSGSVKEGWLGVGRVVVGTPDHCD